MNNSNSPAARLPRRRFLLASAALALPTLGVSNAAPAPVFAEVWKDPNCGCCKDWVAYLEANGFKVKVNESGNAAMRQKLGIATQYGSCHTALIGGYAIEGHVPVREIRRLLNEKPQAVGLAVPGMPVGSPGMDGPDYGGQKDAFKVMLLARDGTARPYQAYPGARA